MRVGGLRGGAVQAGLECVCAGAGTMPGRRFRRGGFGLDGVVGDDAVEIEPCEGFVVGFGALFRGFGADVCQG